MQKTIILLLISISSLHCIAQTGYIRLSVVQGGRPDFYFRTLEKIQTGITYSDFTRIAITFAEVDPTPVPDSSWSMQIRALSGNIDGETGTNNLDLDVLSVKTTQGGAIGASYSGDKPAGNLPDEWVELTNGYQYIVEDGPNGDFNDNIVNISWNCDVQKSSTGQIPDYYTVEIDIYVFIVGP